METKEKRICLNLEQAANAVGVSVPTMRRWLQEAAIPALRLGRRWLIPADSLQQWVEEKAKQRAEL